MPERTVASYGSWRSPISSDLIVRDAVGLSSIAVDGSDVYWLESRPGEGGRNVVVLRTPEGHTEDVTPQPFNARTRVHEYGGGDFAVHEGTLYFSNFADQRIYGRAPGNRPLPLTPEERQAIRRHGGRPGRRRLIAVREDHTGPGREPVNEIVSVDLENGEETVLASGNDFYSSPRLSPDGRRLAWLTWNHPNMPWDGTELMVCDLDDDGLPENVERVAGRSGRIHLPAGVVTGRHAPLRLGPDGLVEPVPPARGKCRAALREGGGVRPAAVGLRDVYLRLRLAGAYCLLLHRSAEARTSPSSTRKQGCWSRSRRRTRASRTCVRPTLGAKRQRACSSLAARQRSPRA